MTHLNNRRRDPGGKLPFGIGCLGIMLLSVLVMSALIVALDFSSSSQSDQGISAIPDSGAFTQGDGGSATPEPVLLPTQAGSSTIKAVAQAGPPTTVTTTSTATASTAASATATDEPTSTPTEMPTISTTPAEETIAWPTNTPIPPPLPTPRDTYSWTLKVPILMYHYISEPPEDADKYRQDLSVMPEDFRQQMTYLVENGFETIDLYDLSLAITNKVELPQKPIIITMDDGYRDNYQNAFPILEELGLEATFFLATEFIDQNNEVYMDWDMVEEMAAAGHRFEPHSKTHPDLTVHNREFIIWEVQGSRETIAAHVGYLPRYFAYPGGRYNEEVQQIIAELDFWGAVTTLGGVWNGFNDRFEWTRTRIRDVTSLIDFKAMIE
jgi:peptidoglycan/xylan/chitin deacetylase (PgdA/CDA1 family)